MNPPFARPSPSSLPQPPFQFPPSNFNFTSLFFIPPKPSHFIISATTNHPSPPPPPPPPLALRFKNAQLTNRNLTPFLESKNRSKKLQDLAERFKDGNFETITEFNHLFMRLVLENEVDLAYKLYSTLSNYNFSADGFTFSILVECYCKRNEPMEAKRVLEFMIENGFEKSLKVKTFTQLINSFCKKGKLKQAFEVLEIMGKVKCDPTINTYNCLLKGLCYVGRVEEASELLTKIKKSWNLKLDVYSFTAVMNGFCKVGRTDEALELLDEAIEMGLTPSIATYNTIFHGYVKEGRPKDGFGLLKQMKERGCNPDYISYCTLLYGLLQFGEVRDGIRVYNEMLNKRFYPDDRMMNTLLRGICNGSWEKKKLLKYAYQVFDEMSRRGCRIDPRVHELIIKAFCNGNEMDKAFVNLCEMLTKDLSLKTSTLNSVVRGLCVARKIEKAMLVLILVCKGRRGILAGVTFDVLINGMNLRGLVKRSTCMYFVALKNGVNPQRKPV